MPAKVWFITGASRGFGRAIAEAALERGDLVVATARNPETLEELVSASEGRACAVRLDVTDENEAKQAIAQGVEKFGRIDVVVNNAGYADLGSIEETPSEQFRAQIETNLFGVIHVSRAVVPVFRKQRSGRFIQFSTIGGRRPAGPGLAAYTAAKHGVEGFSSVLAAETKPFGVKVTLIEPGGFRTDWAGSSMKIIPPGEPYQETVGILLNIFSDAARTGRRPSGDPKKAANVILKVADMEEPPQWLPLGSDAVNMIRQADELKLAELAKWEELSLSTDADDAVHPDLSKL
ncbi:short-chain dehydrogenase/reductase [Paenibacillus cisolokensis]|uniref:Short-chain dehydrogenase/reductase n=1 Tax=Paenibacillus cisolokensis TaxID=1658519 RepID=A0ABQ4NEN3_9BACL|nr:SDR family NAD(P)-dependent oxidoreductase [Paenibacillus cisolokensis]GIQ66686.1 short-chain dehydrogenase/reductase [Paenibacillus cisolokensis]